MKCKNCGGPVIECKEELCACKSFPEYTGYTHTGKSDHLCRNYYRLHSSMPYNKDYGSVATPEWEEPALEIVLE